MTRIFAQFFEGVRPRKAACGEARLVRKKGKQTLARLYLLGGAFLGFSLTGCSLIPPPTPDPTKYYVLTSPDGPSSATHSPAAVRVGVRPIDLPGYLRSTKTIVVRAGANEIRYEDFARWAEPIDTGLTRVLRDELLRSEAVLAVERPPYSPDALPKYEIALRVTSCEGALSSDGRGEVRFVVTYELISTEDRHLMLQKTFVAPAKSWDGKDHGALAQFLSEDIGALADEIAAGLPK